MHGFTLDMGDTRKFIDPQKRQNIYPIFKEAITNIVKHSDATHVDIVFSEQRNQLHLVIRDNGSQLQSVTLSDGLGLSNMQMRATQLGGHLTANYEAGFKVELILG